MKLFAWICFLAAFSLPAPADSTFTQVFSDLPAILNGGFENGTEKMNLPAEWKIEGRVRRVQDEKGNWKLKLSGKESDNVIRASQIVPIPESFIPAVTVSALIKAKDIQSAHDDSKAEGAVVIKFFTEKGKPTGKVEDLGTWDGTFGWRPWSEHARIPPQAKTLELSVELRETSGSFLLDEVKLLWGLPEDEDRSNFIVDGGFEYPSALSAWTLGEGLKIVYPGFAGNSALSASVPESGKSLSAQQLVLDFPEPAQKAEVELNYKLDDVKTTAKNGGARVEIEFQDSREKVLGNSVLGPWTGSTSEWKEFSSEVTIPLQTKTAWFRLIMENAKGKAQFDELRFHMHSKKGLLERPLESRNDTRGWKEFKFFKEPLEGAMDVSGFLDPPAGRHGFLKTGEDGHFYFEDGTRVRFFGINLQPPQALPSHEEAEQLALRLSQHGFNLVRLHHLDAPWGKPNLFDPEFDDTQHFSKESLDRLGYFISQLKSRGIYIYLDLLVSRKFKRGDKVVGYRKLSRAAKGASLFNRRLIELQKKYAEKLFNYKNPYTGLKLKDEPAIVLTEITNENSLCRFSKKLREIPKGYQRELESLVGENSQDLDDPVVQKRYAEIQKKYFLEMRDFLRKIGLKIPIAGSNFALGGLDLETNALLDFIDRHAYWDPPQGGVGDLVKFHNSLLTREIAPPKLNVDSKRVNPMVKLNPLRVPKKPFVVGEWNIDWPNEYRAVGPLIFAAYASLWDWDAILQFNYESKPGTEKIESNFDVSFKPEISLQYPVAARLFYRSDVSSANNRVFTPDTFELKWEDKEGRVLINTPRTQAALGLVGGKRLEFPDTVFEISTPYAAVSVTSLEDAPLRDSSHLLLTATARLENTDTIYNATRTLLRASGSAPILAEPVQGKVYLHLAGRMLPQVFGLDYQGARQEKIPVKQMGDLVEISLGQSFLYEIILGKDHP